MGFRIFDFYLTFLKYTPHRYPTSHAPTEKEQSTTMEEVSFLLKLAAIWTGKEKKKLKNNFSFSYRTKLPRPKHKNLMIFFHHKYILN